MPRSSPHLCKNITCISMQNTWEEHEAIPVSRGISSFSALPLIDHLGIIWWTHWHLKVSLMPTMEIYEYISSFQNKYKIQCRKTDVSRPDVAVHRQFGKVLKGLIKLCHQYPSGFCVEADDATAEKSPTTVESLIVPAGDLASSLRSI